MQKLSKMRQRISNPMHKKNLVLLGANGQLGQSFSEAWCETSVSEFYNLLSFDKAQLDISCQQSISAALAEKNIAMIVNAAAFTAVDKAEEDSRPGTQQAFAINHRGAENVAHWASENGSGLIHISTDFVFDGLSSIPYKPSDITNPLGVYGASKLAGEQAITALLPCGATIIRTSWLYSQYQANFLKTMLRLMTQRDSIGVVADQIGTPTSTHSLVQCIFAVLLQHAHSAKSYATEVFHFSDEGEASWYDFALAISEQALQLGILNKAIEIKPISTEQYPTPAKRPAYSVLDKSRSYEHFGISPSPWRVELGKVLTAIKNT